MTKTTVVKPVTCGRMGNFLFQAATAMAYAWRHNIEFTLPSTTSSPKNNPIYLQHLVNPKWDPTLPSVNIEETSHAYRNLPWDEQWRGKKNVVIHGYRQSEKYFAEYRDRILESFGYEWKLLKGFVSVHIRRTDYLRLTKKHPLITKEWIESAMAQFQGFHFIMFSDDVPWCETAFRLRVGKDITISKGRKEEQDLIYMSHCEHHVCSASTFSWWGAWLNRNPDKRVIMPKQWFTPGWGGLDTSDIVPPEWERL